MVFQPPALSAEHTVGICCLSFLSYLKCSVEECSKESPGSFGTELFFFFLKSFGDTSCYKIKDF